VKVFRLDNQSSLPGYGRRSGLEAVATRLGFKGPLRCRTLHSQNGADFQVWQSMFRIEFTPEAITDLRFFRKYDQERIVRGIEAQLPHQATEPSRNRKRLRPNQLAEWELRIGDFRVFYDVDLVESLVKIEAIGYKDGSTLFVHGEEYEL